MVMFTLAAMQTTGLAASDHFKIELPDLGVPQLAVCVARLLVCSGMHLH
jgi:hypothetical protein